jgi:hypothetical protein
MHIPMARGTKGNRVLLGIVSGMATKFLVVNLQIRDRAARLAPPAIPAQHLLPQLFVPHGIKTQARIFYWNPVQDAFSICATNVCFCSRGRNLKNLEIDCTSNSGFPLSRFAPAKKSAQIISRQ